MPVSRRLRFEVLRRDNHSCRYCGGSAPDVVLTVDHVIPVALGGGDDPTNLVTACKSCNAGKTSISPDQAVVEDVDAAALLFARAIEVAAEVRRRDLDAVRRSVAEFDDLWLRYRTDEGRGEPASRDQNWELSVERFISLGLNHGDFSRLVLVALSAPGVPLDDRWRYFCGCCWREITERQEMARRLIEDGKV